MSNLNDWDSYVSANNAAMAALGKTELLQILDLLRDTRAKSGTLWVLGNGGSASLASHSVADFSKTAQGLGSNPLRTLAPSEMVALQSAFSNDTSFEYGLASTLDMYLGPDDSILVFSVSGKSPNLLNAIKLAKSKGVGIAAVVGKAAQNLESECDVVLSIASGDYQIVENVQLAVMHWLTKNL